MIDSHLISNLTEFFISFYHFLQRPIVQSQMLAFVVAIFVAHLLSQYLWQLIGVPLTLWIQKKQKGFLWQRFARFIERMLFPLLGILSLQLANTLFANISTNSNLLDLCITYFWIFAAYRLLIAILYTVFNQDIVKQFHRPIIAPLFIVWIILNFLSLIGNIDTIGESQAVTLFGQTLSVGTLVSTLWQAFLWIVITTALRESITTYIKTYTTYHNGLAEAWLTILSYISYIIALIVFLNRLGINQNTIAFITGGLSVGVGFGLRSIIANFFSGIILLFERLLRPGDVLEINGVPVTVNQLNIRTTRAETFDGEEIIIPNETIFTSNLHTFSGTADYVRCDIEVGIHYRHDPHQVCEMLLDIARQNIDVLQKPEPMCFVVAFADSSINLSLRVWVANYARKVPVRSDLMKTIWYEFKNAGIEIPYPQQDLHMKASEFQS